MGRWVDISRVRVPRDWMLPGPGEITLDSDRITEYEKEPIQTAQRPHRSRWARGRRKPLRRGRNLPGPLETPDFVTRREPVQDEWRVPRIPLPAVVFAVSALVTAFLTRLFGGS